MRILKAILAVALVLATTPVSFAQSAPRISSSPAYEFLRNPPLVAEGDVRVEGRNLSWRVRPYTLYHYPYPNDQIAFYSPSSSPALKNFGMTGYSGHIMSLGGQMIAFYQPEPMPSARGQYWAPGRRSALVAIDGYQFKDVASLEHYLTRQPPGRVVEYVIGQPNAAGQNVLLVYYAPLLPASADAIRDFQAGNNAAYRRDREAREVNLIGALFVGGLVIAAAAAASAPPDPDPFNCEAKRRYQRESGAAIIVAC